MCHYLKVPQPLRLSDALCTEDERSQYMIL